MKGIIFFLSLITLTSCTSQEDYKPSWWIAEPAPEIIKDAHKYHGILISEQDEDCEPFFYRNGEKCKLFTENFMQWYGERR